MSGMEAAFVADRDGLLVAQHNSSDVDEAIATVFEGFLRQFEPFVEGRVDGHVALMAGDRRLFVTWHHSVHGRYYLGLAGQGDPPTDAVRELGQALRDALGE